MNYKTLAAAAAIALVGVLPAAAQEPRVEISVLGGWTLSDGVEGDTVLGGDGNLYDRIDPKDSFNWGLQAAGLVSDGVEIGFLFNQQMTTFQVSGTATKDIGDTTINGYHGYIGYNLGDSSSTVRPYIMIGAGATSYSGLSFTRANGQTQEIGGDTQFSTTWGAGVKIFPSPKVGLRMGMRWTPTYIKSDAEGYWCDPYWGCYMVGDAQYSNQWDFSGGITFRF